MSKYGKQLQRTCGTLSENSYEVAKIYHVSDMISGHLGALYRFLIVSILKLNHHISSSLDPYNMSLKVEKLTPDTGKVS